MKHNVGIRRWHFLFVLFAVVSPAIFGQGFLDITGPIDPNYAIPDRDWRQPVDSTVPIPDQYLKGAQPLESFSVDSPDEVSHYLEGVFHGDGHTFRLHDPDCHRANLARSLAIHDSRGYEISEIHVDYHEMPYRNWQGSYYRVVQRVKLKLRHRHCSHRPPIWEQSACKMKFWRW